MKGPRKGNDDDDDDVCDVEILVVGLCIASVATGLSLIHI